MPRRSNLPAQPPAASGPPPRSRRGLRPTSELPPRAKLFLAAAGIALLAFGVWVTVRLLDDDGLALAILLCVLSYIGIVVVGTAILTATRMAFSMRAVPYLLGRVVRWLLVRR